MASVKHLTEKCWYFTLFGSLSVIVPYFNLFFKRLGCSEDIVGLLAALTPWIVAAFSTPWAAFADKHRKHKLILVSTVILSTLFRSLMISTKTLWVLIILMTIANIIASAIMPIADAAIIATCKEDQSYGKQRLWGAVGWGICSILAGSMITRFGVSVCFILFPVMSIFVVASATKLNMDALTAPVEDDETEIPHVTVVELVKAENGKEFTSGTKLVNMDVDIEKPTVVSVPEEGRSDPVANEQTATLAAIIAVEEGNDEEVKEDTWLLHAGDNEELKEKSPNLADDTGEARKSFTEKLMHIIRQPEVCVFLLMSFVMGTGSGTIENFLFLYLDELGAPEILMGLSLTVTCAAEIPLFYFMNKILDALGTLNTLHMCMFTFSLRLMLYSILAWFGSPWYVLLIEPLHGVTFGCAWGAGTEHSRRIAPPGLDATLQSIFAGLYFGIGYGAGALAAGTLYAHFGARVMFSSMSGFLAINFVLCLVASRLVKA